jgi:hypothetical protein
LAPGDDGVSDRRIRALVAAALLVVGLLLAVAAVDALRWRGLVRRDDVAFDRAHGQAGLWHADALLPGDPVPRLIGVRDDLAYRRALQRWVLARPGQEARNQHDLTLRADADAQLTLVAEAGATAETRSRAATLRGVLALDEARSSGPRGGAAIERSLDQFRTAIRLDPANSQAKYDLELVLRLARSAPQQRGRRPGARPNSGTGTGAGASSNQSGF